MAQLAAQIETKCFIPSISRTADTLAAQSSTGAGGVGTISASI